jgi:hypothetical protein
LQNDGVDPEFNEHNFGLLRYWQEEIVPWAAKENFVALNTLSHKLNNNKFLKMITTDNDTQIYYFINENNPAHNSIILWNDNSLQQIGLRLGTNKATVTDMLGNSTLLKPVSEIFTVSSSDFPLYLEGKFKTIQIEKPKFRLAKPNVQVVAGDNFNLNIIAPLQANFNIDMKLPVGWQITKPQNNPHNSKNITKLSIQTAITSPQKLYDLPIYIKSGKSVVARLNPLINVRDSFDVHVRPDLQLSFKNNQWHRKWALLATLQNNSTQNQYAGQIIPHKPDQWKSLTKPKTFNNLMPQKTAKFLFPAPIAQDGSPLKLDLMVKTSSHTQHLFSQKLNLLAATKTNSPILIDGNSNDWQNAIPFYLNHISQIERIDDWTGTNDISGTGYMQWDFDYLYLLVEVTDDIFSQLASNGSEIWKGDSIQLGIDFELQNNSVHKGHHEFGFALCNDNVTAWRWYSAYKMPRGPFNDANAKISKNKNYITYEIALPWKALLPPGREPCPNEMFGFALIINDSDQKDSRGWIAFMRGIGRTKDPNLYGKVLLAP